MMPGYLHNNDIINLKDFQIIYLGFNLVLQDSKRTGSFTEHNVSQMIPSGIPKKKASSVSYLKQLLRILRSALNEHSKINQDKRKRKRN